MSQAVVVAVGLYHDHGAFLPATAGSVRETAVRTSPRRMFMIPRLRRALCQAAWGAARTKDSYFQAQYRRLAGRRGKKRAAVAVGHTLLEVIYHLLKDPTVQYRDLGGDYFDHLDPKRLCRHLVKRLESLGYEVTLAQNAAA